MCVFPLFYVRVCVFLYHVYVLMLSFDPVGFGQLSVLDVSPTVQLGASCNGCSRTVCILLSEIDDDDDDDDRGVDFDPHLGSGPDHI